MVTDAFGHPLVAFFYVFSMLLLGLHVSHGVSSMLSPHNPSIVWLGGNRLFKSLNRGDTWVASADLTKQVDQKKVSLMSVPGDRRRLSQDDGVSHYGTIVSLSESPVLPGIVWAGTDDGNVQVSKDSAATFTEVGKNMWRRRRRNVALSY